MAPGIPLRVLVYNTFLLTLRLPRPADAVDLAAGRASAARARELGPAIAGRYDVAALCEVFHERERRAVLAGWPGAAVDHAVGPGRRAPLLGASSGLLTIVDGPRITRTATHEFRHRGVLWRDADPLAAKGVLLAEIDAGAAGNLEVYSTHLMAGNDFLKRRDGAYGSITAVRHRQVDEVVEFVGQCHRPENVALLVGDFNLVAAHSDEAPPAHVYGGLRDRLDRAGFDDVWAGHGSGPGYTYCDRGHPADACRLDPVAPELCAEPAAPPAGKGAKRIDYAWLQRPDPAHRARVTVRSVRRRSFPRSPGAEGYGRVPHLSDHLGLHLELSLTTA